MRSGAAAFVAATTVAGSLLLGACSESEATAPPPRLLPATVPDGFSVRSGVDLVPQPDDGSPGAASWVVVARTPARDRVVVLSAYQPEGGYTPALTGAAPPGEPVTIGDRAGHLRHVGADDVTAQVEWLDRGTSLTLSASGFTDDETLALATTARHAGGGNAARHSFQIPAGLTVTFDRDPLPLLEHRPSWRMEWAKAGSESRITVSSISGDEERLELASLMAGRQEHLEVRGHDAVVVHGAIDPASGDPGAIAMTSLTWVEAAGVVVHVEGRGLGLDALEEVAASLAPTEDATWKAAAGQGYASVTP